MNHIQVYHKAFTRSQCEYYIYKYKDDLNKFDWTGFYTGISILEHIPIEHYIQQYIQTYSLQSYSLIQYRYKNIQHYEPGQSYSIPHIERSQVRTSDRFLVFMIYLNTVTDQGYTVFPEQNTILKPIQGNLIIWPTTFPYVHYGVNSSTQHKFILTGWYVLSDGLSSLNHND